MPRAPAKRRSGRPSNPLTRGDIVAAARAVFAQRGVDGVSLRELADLCGIRKASLYHHFEKKDDLYQAVMEDAVHSVFTLIAAARLDEGDFLERIDRLGALIVDAFAAHPELPRLLIRELMGEGPYMAAGGLERVQATLEMTAAFLQAGMDAGAFHQTDPRHLALSIASLHLLPFAMVEPATRFLGEAPSTPRQAAARKAAVLAQVRRLVEPPQPRRARRR